MKKKQSASNSAFFNLRTIIGLSACLFGFVISLIAAGILPASNNQTVSLGKNQARPGTQKPDVVQMIGPVSQDLDLRMLPYVPPSGETEPDGRKMRHPFPRPFTSTTSSKTSAQQFGASLVQAAMTVQAPVPLLSFDGIDSNLSGCGCTPPDSDGDVGSNHYIQTSNSSIQVYDKNGNVLAGPITYNSFFAPMGTSTACGNNLNDGDGVVFYDHIADRWVVSDFAFPAGAANGAGPNYQCIGVSKTSDPVAGGWYLYAIQVDATHNTWFGDYPKFAVWPDAYYMSVNLFVNGNTSANSPFEGVRVFAFDRNSMINGGSANTVAFTILPANLGDQYSLVPATFRTGAPPAGQPEWFMDVNSSATAGTVETQVFVRRFHVDFVTPANSTFGINGANHDPDATITVNGFKDAFNATTFSLCPNGTSTTGQWLDTLGDKIMYPMVYQNINGKEYIYADQTILLATDGTLTGPTAVRWYQFDMTGNSIPATPTQQQDFNNGNDGLFRWMPSINVDGSGNMAIGYSVSSTTLNPGIRYAGRTYADNSSTLTQTENVMWAATGHQTSTGDRWGDYSTMFVDPTDNCTFYHVNEYYAVTSTGSWRTRVGTFKFSQCTGAPLVTPTPSPSATPTPTPTPNPTPPPTPTPGTSPTPSPTPPASAGNVTVVATAGTTGPTGYATVQSAFAAINAGTHQGAVTVWIIADTAETTSCLLNASGVGSASYSSVLVLPNGTRTVSGSFAGAPLIDLNGAKNVRIDGYNQLTLANTSTSSTAATSTIRFISTTAGAGGAQNNIVANCNIQGSNTVPIGTAGGNLLFSTTTASGTNIVGNNNNIIANNDIGPAGGNLPLKCISAAGTTTNANTINTGNIIFNNNIHDFFNATANTAGIDIRTGNTSFTIWNNRLYQTATRTFTGAAGLRYSGIVYSGSTGTGATSNWGYISGNVIGFGTANGTGTTTITGTGTGAQNEVRGIDVNATSSGTATEIYGNIISGINQTSGRIATTTCNSAFTGISACASGTATSTAATGTTDIGTVSGNTIGSLDGSSTIVINATSTTASTTPVFGILGLTASGNFINNNQIGAITIQGAGTVTGFRGIFPGATAATTQTINNNTIGGPTAAGAISDTQLGNYAVYGIQTSTAACVITGNVIRNLSGTANVAGSVNESGIAFTSTSTTAVSTISGNTIYNLSNSSGAIATNIYGLDLTMPTSTSVTGNLVERNFIHSLSITSTDNTSQIFGIIVRGPASGTSTVTVQNNMIQLGLDASGNSITSGFLIRGIRDSVATGTGITANAYYYNSVYIGGTNVASSSNSTAFFSDVVTNTRTYRNNIFWNARSNASGTGKNYAIAVGGTTVNPTGLTSNRNDLYATGTGGFVGLYNTADQTTLANWQAATGQDANSISSDPLFVNANGSATTANLHILAGSPAISGGTPVTVTAASPLTGILNDFDNYARSATTPTIGAVEYAAAPVLQSVVSRFVHGGAGTFDLALSTSSRVIEPRSDTTGNFTIVFNFNAPIVSGTAKVTSGTGNVGSVTYSGNSMIVGLTGVTDQQNVTVAVSGVGSTYSLLTSASVQAGFLWGDATQDGFVNVGDTIVVRNQSGNAIDNTNFIDDVNVDGSINVGDTIRVRANSGDYIP